MHEYTVNAQTKPSYLQNKRRSEHIVAIMPYTYRYAFVYKWVKRNSPLFCTFQSNKFWLWRRSRFLSRHPDWDSSSHVSSAKRSENKWEQLNEAKTNGKRFEITRQITEQKTIFMGILFISPSFYLSSYAYYSLRSIRLNNYSRSVFGLCATIYSMWFIMWIARIYIFILLAQLICIR